MAQNYFVAEYELYIATVKTVMDTSEAYLPRPR